MIQCTLSPTVATAAGLLSLGLFTLGSLVAAASVVFPKLVARRTETS
jgi:hypothetical protein